MYIGVSDYRFRPGTDFQTLIQRIEQEAMPMAQELQGWQAYYFVRVADDRVLAVSVWDSKAGFDNGLPRLLPWMQENVAPHLASAPERAAGEVVFQAQR